MVSVWTWAFIRLTLVNRKERWWYRSGREREARVQGIHGQQPNVGGRQLGAGESQERGVLNRDPFAGIEVI